MRTGLRLSVAAARGMRVARMPTGTGIAWLADVPDREPGHGPPQLVIRRKHPVIAMPVLPRRRDDVIGRWQTVEALRSSWRIKGNAAMRHALPFAATPGTSW